MSIDKARLICFYLPQYHPIPENDKWWGKGFTEWTNVARSKPLYKGHRQPIIPADLGFYDLRVPDTRVHQAQLAKSNGIEGFCYWHYWFGNGKRILERVFDEVLRSGEPDFPFCLAWANQTWTGHWHGNDRNILVKQNYGGIKDYTDHFYEVLPAFKDDRYIKVDEKPLFLIYNPWDIPNPKEFTDCWRELAVKCGLKDIFFVAIDNEHKNINSYGMDASTWHEPTSHVHFPERFYKRWLRKYFKWKEYPKRVDYRDFVKYSLNKPLPNNNFPMVVPNWDNTPRSGRKGLVYEGATPELFKEHLRKAVKSVQEFPNERKIIFIKSWNEWAEGNYLEPDQHFGDAFLKSIKDVVLNK